MKNKPRMIVLIISLCMASLPLHGSILADSITIDEWLNQYRDSCVPDEKDSIDKNNLQKDVNPTWFPGFIIVQLLKGILAFFVILLILFDIIEP